MMLKVLIDLKRKKEKRRPIGNETRSNYAIRNTQNITLIRTIGVNNIKS